MATIFQRANDALAALSPAIPFAMDTFKQVGSAALPSQYITYQLISGVPEAHADNAETMRSYRVQVNIMSDTGLAVLPDVNAVMLAAGFTKGPERSLPKNESTGHYVLAKDYFYLEVL
ncbi:MAG: hypothetical protein KAY78_02820 [Pseudomonadales bacterium]|nr:hypothetical protein [Pseudomonadales bacterium]